MLLRNVVLAYFTIGMVVCFVHSKIIRDHIAKLADLDLGISGVLIKPIMALIAFVFACAVWPIAWFNVGKSGEKSQEALDAQFQRLKALHAAMNPPITYAGGDGSSFEQAVLIIGATILSGPQAEYSFIEQRYPGYKRCRQFLRQQNGRSYDVLEFLTADGENKAFYFDISNYYPT